MCSQHNALDVNSSTNHHEIQTRHTDIQLVIDFERKIVKGTVLLTAEAIATVEELVLDTSHLTIQGVAVNANPASWDLKPRQEPNGSPLHIRLDKTYNKGETCNLKIEFESTTASTGIQWFNSSQTDDKEYPFMFTQCEPVHARAIFPCQDTPSVKTTFVIGVESPLPVVASGVPDIHHTASTLQNYPALEYYRFTQEIPVSNYLFAVASGNLVGGQIADKSYLYCSPGNFEMCKAELQPDLQDIMHAAEKLIYEYPWPFYNLVVLPKSFHLGGMENPIFNFYSATVISGDRENINVVAHEFAHSFSGNLVTNASWEHFWLNEGWTVYIERFILREIRGEAEEALRAMIGWRELQYGIESYGGEDSQDTSMVLDFRGKRPDDIMSTIVYEKGYTFLRYLESVVGRPKWLKFVPHYFRVYAQGSVDSNRFKATLLEFFTTDLDATENLGLVDWDMWFYKPGSIPEPDLQSPLYEDCVRLADRWPSWSASPSPRPCSDDVEGWSVGQKIVFLDELLQNSAPIPREIVHEIGLEYKLSTSTNLEVLTRYLRLALRVGDLGVVERTEEVLGETGRMKFVRPLFEGLISVDVHLAAKVYMKYQDFYHPTCLRLIKGVLNENGLLESLD